MHRGELRAPHARFSDLSPGPTRSAARHSWTRSLRALLVTAALLMCVEYYATRGGGQPAGVRDAVTHAGIRAPRLPPATPAPPGVPAALHRHGNCWYRPPPGALCAESGRLVLFGAGQDTEIEVELCTGYPQNRRTYVPEKTGVSVVLRRQLPSDPADALGGTGTVTVERETRVTLLDVTTLESNFFHVVRDTVANLVDMVARMPEGQGVLPLNGRVVLLPKHRQLRQIDSNAFHFAFAGLTARPWREHVLKIERLAPPGKRVCFEAAYLGQPYEGHQVGGPRRREEAAVEWAAAGGKLRLLFVDRGVGGRLGCQGGPNRKIENQAELVAMAEAMGFYVRVVKLHTLPSTEAQLRLVHGADVLMGAHGMALTWCTFLRAGAVLLELGIWRDVRADYRFLSKWSGVHRLYVPLLDPDAVYFPKVNLTRAEKFSVDYYRPYSNIQMRQCQVIRPDASAVRRKLTLAKQLASDPRGGAAEVVLDPEPRKPSCC
eukprot:TRINITY_DN32898_c0_g1_i2.p1 TRINITY_DN32898_c0_g1~~TRINITY_DN32898_c0_g1_i2.p1  ORF type:complete len:519 (+),score=112.51 TRINITY_DN32898_c0_g1_i2:90-1559(+)